MPRKDFSQIAPDVVRQATRQERAQAGHETPKGNRAQSDPGRGEEGLKEAQLN